MAELSDLPLRDELRGMVPYGAPELDVPVRLNVNENPHGVPEAVLDDIVAAVGEAVRGAHRYPERDFPELREALAGYLNGRTGTDDAALAADNIWAANGSNEVMQQLLQAFGGPGRKALGFPPTYSMYSNYAAGTQTEYVTGERGGAADGWVLTPEAAAAAVALHRPNIVFLCKPNNPTGTALGLDVVEAVYAAADDAIVVVDEAYAEFDDTPSAIGLLPGRPRLVVSRTMSKAFAFAGVRLGYLAADPGMIDALRLVRLPYHLSVLTQAAALAALRHAPEMLAQVDEIKAQRDRIVAELPALGYTPWSSASNFVLFGGIQDPQRLFRALLEQGVLVRDPGVPNTLRVTAGTEAETTAFLAALAAAR